MPLFHVGPDGLVPFRRVVATEGSAQEVEASLAAAMWSDLPTALGEDLFPVHNGMADQVAVGGHQRKSSALVALDQHANVVVICVRHTFDQNALAACLESVGWARNITVSELADLYWGGADAFWQAWQEFAGASGMPAVSHKPRLLVIASELATASRSALDFLLDHDLPVQVMQASLYAGPKGSQVLDVQAVGRSNDNTARPQAVTSRLAEDSRAPSVPQFSELSPLRAPQRRPQDLPPFDTAPGRAAEHARPEKFPAHSRPGDPREIEVTPVAAGPSFGGSSHKTPSIKPFDESPRLGPEPAPAPEVAPLQASRDNTDIQASEPARRHHEAEQRPEQEVPRQEHRKLDPLADTLIRVQAANKARLTGTPAVDEDATHAHRANTESESEAERSSGAIARPQPRVDDDRLALGGFRGEEPGELHMVANGTNPRYRAGDMGELPPEWD